MPPLAHRAFPTLLGFTLGSRHLRDADVYWHLTLGRAVLRHGTRKVPEPTAHFAWTDPCIAKDWLWDLLCYALHQAGGMTLVGFLPAIFGAAIGYRAARLTEISGAARPLQTCLALLAVAATAEVLDARPNLILLCLVPLYLELCLRLLRAPETRTRSRLALGLIASQLLWSQLHSSFVLGPLLFSCLLFEHKLSRVPLPPRFEIALLTLALLLATCTSAYGWSIAQLIAPHASGDAVRHIIDMKPFDWSELSLTWHTTLAAAVLCAVGIAGAIAGGAPGLAGSTLAALGLGLTASSARFVFLLALLCLCWASTGARILQTVLAAASFRRLQLVAGGVTAVALALCLARIHDPLFRYGVAPDREPRGAMAYLAQLPRGSAVFTEFTLGAPIGFYLDGKVRTFVDGRTPMYFDDTDWALARDMLSRPDALQRGLERYGFAAALVERESSVCPLLEALWTPVVIEARYTTFVPRDRGAAVPVLSACGRNYLRADACSGSQSAWQDALHRQAGYAQSGFLRLMAAARALQCGGTPPDPASLPLPDSDAVFMPTYRLYLARALFAAHRPDEALAVIERALRADDALAALSLLQQPEAGEVSIASATPVLARALAIMDDNAPAPLRARMAFLCMAGADPECARFQGLRAFVSGDSSVRPVLAWAARHHPSSRVRTDLSVWLELHP